MSELFEAFRKNLERVSRSDETIRGYLSDLYSCKEKGIIDDCLNMVSANNLLEYPVQPATKHRWIASIKKYASFLHKEGLLDSIPTQVQYLEAQPVKSEMQKVISQTELKSLLSLKTDDKTKAVLYLLVATGCRIQSLTGIRVEDIGEDFIRFGKAKGGKPYTSVLPPDAKKAVEVYMSTYGITEGLLFRQKNGKAETANNIRMGLKNRLGGNYINPHTIRRSIATALIENGASLFDVKEFLNHNNIQVTTRYTKLTSGAQNKRLEGIHPLL